MPQVVVGAKQTYVISQKNFNCLKEGCGSLGGTASKMNVKIFVDLEGPKLN